ncbi:MAG: hypothetical protein HGA45_00990 [Chloroflexales bacterium]|nr:hypothetical protein [Chloroflexales bacterium]
MNTAGFFPSRVPHGARVWLWWVGMSTLGWFLGYWASFILIEVLLMGSPLAVVGMAVFYMLTGAAVGLMQWWVLSVHYPSPVHRWRWWVPAGIVGIGLPVALYALIWGDPLYDLRWLPAIALGGALVGVLQQRILRHWVARSWWWVPASTVGWTLGPLVYLALFTVVWPPWGPSPAYALPLTLVLPGLTLALVTASAIIWLLRRPARPTSSPVT